MKSKELNTKTAKELRNHVDKLRRKLSVQRSELHFKDVKDVRTIRRQRRELARTLTILRQKEEA